MAPSDAFGSVPLMGDANGSLEGRGHSVGMESMDDASSLAVRALTLTAEMAMVFGGVVPYIPQYPPTTPKTMAISAVGVRARTSSDKASIDSIAMLPPSSNFFSLLK